MSKFIKKLDDFFEMVKEAFKDPLEIQWIDKAGHLVGLFEINDNVYQINCVEKENNIWKFDFYSVERKADSIVLSPDMTNRERDKFRVLPTVLVGLEYLVLQKSPEAIILGAADSSKGRKKLYASFLEDFCLKIDYKFYTKVYQTSEDITSTKQLFVLYKEGGDIDKLYSTIISSIEDEK
jgi:hypothetical protein